MNNEEKASKWEISNAERISELEKSDKDTNQAFADVSVKFIELEKKYKDFYAEMIEYIKTTNLRNDDRKEEIAELKERMMCIEEAATEKRTQLNELKEAIHNLQHWNQSTYNFEQLNIIKEVLRELLGNIQVFGSDSGYFGLEAQANSLLAKLSGVGSASARESLDRQTVKDCNKCVYSNGSNKCWATKGLFDPTNPKCDFRAKEMEKKEVDCDECQSWALGCELDGSRRRDCSRQDYKFFRPKKDSGGEKTVVSEGGVSNPVKIASLNKALNNRLPADSKPPEPKWKGKSRMEFRIKTDDDKPIYQPIKSDALDSLLHALPDFFKLNWWHEQIKHFVPTHKLVKREDLQFLYEYSYPEGVFDDDLIDEFYAEKKRIKEEYNV